MLRKALVIAACISFFACSDDPAVGAQALDSEAINTLRSAQPAEIVVTLKAHLQSNPGDTRARLLLADTFVRLSQWSAVEEQARFILKQDEANSAAVAMLSDVYIVRRRHSDLVELSIGDAGTDALAGVRLFANQAVGHAALGNAGSADLYLESAEEFGVGEKYITLARARIEMHRGEFADAMPFIDHLMDSDSRLVDAWVLRGRIRMNERNWDAAVADYSEALKLRPGMLIARVNMAIALTYSGRIAQAQAAIQQISADERSHPLVTYADGVLLFTQKNFVEAKSKLEATLGAISDYPSANYYAGISNLALGNWHSAEAQLRRFDESAPDDPLVNRLLGEIAMIQGDSKSAEDYARTALETDEMSLPAIFLLASTLLAQGQSQEGLEYLQLAVSSHPESVEARTELGAHYLELSELAQAEQVLKEAVALDPRAPKPRELLFAVLLEAGRQQEASAVLENYAADFPNDRGPLNLKGGILLSKGKVDQAREAFEAVLKIDGADPSANSGLASIAMSANDSESAIGYYENVLAFSPGDLETLNNLAEVYSRTGETEKAVTVLESAIEFDPEHLPTKLSLANLKLKSGDSEAVITLLEGLEGGASYVSYHALLGEAYYLQRDFSAAARHLETLVSLQPANGYARELLTDALARQGQIVEALASAKKLHENEPDNKKVLERLIRLELQAGTFSDAVTHTAALRKLTGGDPESLYLSGLSSLGARQFEDAADYFSRVYEERPNSATLVYLSNALWQLDKREESLSLLQEWVAEFPQDEVVFMELANRHMSLRDWAAARSAYEAVLSQNPESSLALNNLAWMLRESAPKEAEAFSRRAVSLAPNSSEALDTHAVVLMNAGKLGEARKMADRAMKLAPGNRDIQFHRAQILAAAGRSESAITALEYLLEDGVEFSEKDQAERLLTMLRDS